MGRRKLAGHSEIAYDTLFLSSFLLTMGFSVLVFVDLVFLVPAILSFSIWLILTLLVLGNQGVSVRHSILRRRLMSGLPANRKLHAIYVAALLVSLMLFFGLMVITTELYLLLAFMIWLFLGYLVLQELGGGEEPVDEKKARKH